MTSRTSVARPFPPSTSMRDIVRGLEDALERRAVDDRTLGLVELRAMSLFFRSPKHSPDYEGPFVDPYKGDPATYFSGDTLLLLKQLLQNATEHPIRARLADVLQWRNEDRAENRAIAIDEYLTAFESMGGDIYGSQLLLRAAQLSAMSPTVNRCASAIRAAALRYEADLHGDLRDVVTAAHLLRKRDAALLTDVLDSLDRATAVLSTRGDVAASFERELLALAIDAARETKQPARSLGFKLRLAQSHERTANYRPAETAGSAFLEAAKAYKEIGQHSKAADLLMRARASGARSFANMKPISMQIPVPTEMYKNELSRELGMHQSRVLYGVASRSALWVPKSVVAARVAKMTATFLHMSLPRMPVHSDGRIGDTVSEESELLRAQIVEHFVFSHMSALAMIQTKLQMLRDAGIWSQRSVMTLFEETKVLSEGTLSAISIGVNDFEEGRFWSALHVLIPQVERAVREISHLLVIPNVNYKAKMGEMHWKTLTQLLGDPNVYAALDSLQPDFSWHLRSLLIDGEGANIRDNLAHGITSTSDPIQLQATLAIFILMILSSYPVP